MSDDHGLPSEPVTAAFPDLRGRAAIVTGASRGIGCGIAGFLGRQGMKLVLAARSEEAGTAFAESLRTGGVDCEWVTADLATPEGARILFDRAVERYGTIYLLVNNAAILWSKTIQELDPETYADTFEANVRMTVGISHLVSQHMAGNRAGVIVHISSVGGLRGHEGRTGYDASKGAVDAITRSMAVDLGPCGVRVNAVAPGATAARPIEGRMVGFNERASKHVPLGRMGTPEEMGAVVAFLASDAARYITGQILYVDGGLTMQLGPPGVYI